MKETQREWEFTPDILSKEARAVSITDCQANNPYALNGQAYRQEEIQELMIKLLEDVRKYKNHLKSPKALLYGEKELSTIPEKDKSINIFCSRILDSFLSNEFRGFEFAPIPPGMDEDEFDEEEVDCYDHDTSSDNESYENIEYVDIASTSQFGKVSSIGFRDSGSFFEESDTSLSHSDNSLPEFETFSDHTEETRSRSTTTHANNSLPEYDSFLFEIEPNQGGLTSVVISDNSNDPLLEFPEFESFHFDLDPSFPRPPPEPLDVEISLIDEPDA
ncbi:hypothetical protein Tco_0388600 [Tanacetum coccineum]